MVTVTLLAGTLSGCLNRTSYFETLTIDVVAGPGGSWAVFLPVLQFENETSPTFFHLAPSAGLLRAEIHNISNRAMLVVSGNASGTLSARVDLDPSEGPADYHWSYYADDSWPGSQRPIVMVFGDDARPANRSLAVHLEFRAESSGAIDYSHRTASFDGPIGLNGTWQSVAAAEGGATT